MAGGSDARDVRLVFDSYKPGSPDIADYNVMWWRYDAQSPVAPVVVANEVDYYGRAPAVAFGDDTVVFLSHQITSGYAIARVDADGRTVGPIREVAVMPHGSAAAAGRRSSVAARTSSSASPGRGTSSTWPASSRSSRELADLGLEDEGRQHHADERHEAREEQQVHRAGVVFEPSSEPIDTAAVWVTFRPLVHGRIETIRASNPPTRGTRGVSLRRERRAVAYIPPPSAPPPPHLPTESSAFTDNSRSLPTVLNYRLSFFVAFFASWRVLTIKLFYVKCKYN